MRDKRGKNKKRGFNKKRDKPPMMGDFVDNVTTILLANADALATYSPDINQFIENTKAIVNNLLPSEVEAQNTMRRRMNIAEQAQLHKRRLKEVESELGQVLDSARDGMVLRVTTNLLKTVDSLNTQLDALTLYISQQEEVARALTVKMHETLTNIQQTYAEILQKINNAVEQQRQSNERITRDLTALKRELNEGLQRHDLILGIAGGVTLFILSVGFLKK